MAASNLADAFQLGVDVLGTSVSEKTKKILAQTGSVVGQGQTDADNVEWWQHVGFASRPPKPEAGKQAAQTVVIRGGGTDAAIASQDLRSLALYGSLAPGETCLYAGGVDGLAQARILLKADGSINLFTKKENTSSGSGFGIFVNPDGSISLAGTEGNAVLLTADGSVKIFNASGGVQIKPDGHIKIASSSKVEISGASITLGGAAALPLAIGPQTVTAITALQAQITALQAALLAVQTQCATSFAAIIAVPPVTAAAGAVTPTIAAGTAGVVASGVAVGAGTAAVSAASALIPTLRTSGD